MLVAGISKLHEKLFEYFEVQKELDFQKQLNRSEKRSKFAQKDLAGSVLKLGSLLEKKIQEVTPEGDYLFFAMQKIGQKLKIPVTEIPRQRGDVNVKLQEICSHARLFYREVELNEGWWKSVVGPFLAFYGENRIPIAIINNYANQYEYADPVTGALTRLSDENANKFSKEAYTFFAPLLDEKVTIFSFMKFLFGDCRREIMILFFLAIGTSILNLYMPFAMKQLFDLLTVSANLTVLNQLTLGLVLVAFTTWAFNTTKSFTSGRFRSLSMIRLQMGFWGRILCLPVSIFKNYTAGELVNRFLSANTIETIMTSSALSSFFTFFYVVFYFIQMFLFNAYLTIVMLIPFICVSILYTLCIIRQVKFLEKATEMSGKIQGFVVQMISGLAKLRVANAENRFFNMWANRFFEKKRVEISYQRYQALANLMTILFPMAATVIIYAVGLKEFQSQMNQNVEKVSIGIFVGFAAAFGLFTSNALSLLQLIFTLMRMKPLWKNAKEIIDIPPEVNIDKESIFELRGKIVLDKVFFRYSQEDEWVLKDVSFFANPGEMIAIVGPSGSGKSTLVRLLLGFAKPEQGVILYDDKNLEDIDTRSLRARVGTVLQNGALTAGSIYDNIAGSGNYTTEELKQAIYRSGLERDLKLLPMGIHTIIPMEGGTFSGGQKQRLLLARALIGSPKILILDEATSALDNLMQDFVTSNLEQLNLTRVVIAHRMSTIKNSDRIYVLERGVVTQVGTYQELSTQPGFFSSMLSRQQL